MHNKNTYTPTHTTDKMQSQMITIESVKTKTFINTTLQKQNNK